MLAAPALEEMMQGCNRQQVVLAPPPLMHTEERLLYTEPGRGDVEVSVPCLAYEVHSGEGSSL